MDRLSDREVAALNAALDDEYQAHSTYDQVLHDFGEVRPFANIVDSEARHIAALRRTFERYGVPLPVNPWPGRVERYASLRDACAAAERAEVANAALYDRLLASTERPDLRELFTNLRDASQQRHLPAFRRCLARGPRADRPRAARRGPAGSRPEDERGPPRNPTQVDMHGAHLRWQDEHRAWAADVETWLADDAAAELRELAALLDEQRARMREHGRAIAAHGEALDEHAVELAELEQGGLDDRRDAVIGEHRRQLEMHAEQARRHERLGREHRELREALRRLIATLRAPVGEAR